MKKTIFLLTVFCLAVSACAPAAVQTQSANTGIDLQATVAISVQQTLQSLPTATLAPTNTAVVAAAKTNTPTQVTPTPTETQNPLLLTLTATLGTGTAIATTTVGTTAASTATNALGTPATATNTPNPALSPTPTETLHAQHYGTMPPNLPYGDITLYNKSKAEVYISLQCKTKNGDTTILEYPVGKSIQVHAPEGKYEYVAWVGGKKMIGKFSLDKFQDLYITIYKDRIEIK